MQPQNNNQSYAVVYLNRNGIGDYVKVTTSIVFILFNDSFFQFNCPMSTIVPSSASATNFTIHDLFEDEGKEIIGTINYKQNLTLLVSPGGGVRMVKLVPN